MDPIVIKQQTGYRPCKTQVVLSGLGDDGEGNGFIQNFKIGQYEYMIYSE